LETVAIHGLADGEIIESDVGPAALPFPLENEGRWTTVEFRDGTAICYEKYWHLRNMLGTLIFDTIALVVGYSISHEMLIMFIVLFIPYTLVQVASIVRYSPFRLVVSPGPECQVTSADRVIVASDIDMLLLRENTRRDNDSHRLIQLLIHVHSEDAWVLVYQSYYATRRNAISTAERLATWIEARG